MLASTEIPETWVVFPSGCVLSDPANCTDTRGGTYNVSASNTWNEKKLYTLGTEGNLGYTQNSDVGDYGFDTLEVGVPGRGNVSLDHQLIAGLATKDFYLGNLGLADRTLVFDGGEPETGLMSQLKSQNKIPSLSYGYTAGASYRKLQNMDSELDSTLTHIRSNKREPDPGWLRHLEIHTQQRDFHVRD